MFAPGETARPLRSALAHFNAYVAGWPAGTDSEAGLSSDDANLVSGHIDRVLLFMGPGVPPIIPEPDDAVEAAFEAFAAFVAAWPAGRTDPSSGLTRGDLDLIASEKGPIRPHRPEPAGA